MIKGIEDFIEADLNAEKYKSGLEFELNNNELYVYKGDIFYIYDLTNPADINTIKKMIHL